MIVTVPDKLIAKAIEGKEYVMATDEGEAIGIAAGYYYATGNAAEVYISADGFMNALNPLTSLVIPEGIPINIYVSLGRMEPQHRMATLLMVPFTNALWSIMKSNSYDTAKIHIKHIRKE